MTNKQRNFWTTSLLLGTTWLLTGPQAQAANCSSPGNLVFLGKTSDLSRSVWLSGTGSGSFALEAPSSDVVDTWERSKRGLHVSLSPVVSQGSGLPHTLVDVTGAPCEIDQENQKGGIVFPPIVQLPPKLPPILKPPSGRPSLPGLMPTLPIAVTPPIGTLPPSGIMPTLPGGVTPPIGTLPPSGIMPTLPGGVTPPIGTLPPSGVMPTLPGGVTPPIGTLPPSGVMPELPSIDGSDSTGELSLDGVAPLTPARKFAQEPLWNLWVDSRYTDISDRRSGLDLDGRSGYVTIGADRRMNDDLAVGLMTIFERTRSEGFGGDWKIRSDGISFGPYAAYRLTPEWSVDASFSVGRLDNDNSLAVLSERFDSQRYALGLNATGQYVAGEVILSPKLSLNYSHFRNEEHDMKGSVAGIPIRLGIESENFDYGVAEATLQLTRGYRTDGGKVWYPYAEVGLSNEFERPNDGRIITGDLSQEKTSPWSGSLRTGVQALLRQDVFIDTSVGYLSFGQNGLDVWEGRVLLSIAF
ncbi:MAG: autotransporter domain-containing protein [Pseudomonas sp.]